MLAAAGSRDATPRWRASIRVLLGTDENAA
jgi:hypothetical protein